MAYIPGGGYPSLGEIRSWIQVPATVLSDAELGWVAAGEQTAQAPLDWGTGDLPDNARQAFMRRVARSVAAKGIPLGILAADAEYGTVRLSRWEPEIDRLEAPYVVPVIA
jgi:hypothetical protein